MFPAAHAQASNCHTCSLSRAAYSQNTTRHPKKTQTKLCSMLTDRFRLFGVQHNHKCQAFPPNTLSPGDQHSQPFKQLFPPLPTLAPPPPPPPPPADTISQTPGVPGL
jgi:hypothetical protein